MLTRTGFAILAVSTLGAATLWACGPYFPPWLLGNEAGMLDAPMTWLRDSLAPLLPPGKTVPVAPMAVDGPSPSEQTARADAADLKGALEELKTPTDRREALLEQYRQARKAMTENPKTTVTAPAGLPGEMDDYLRGAIAWHEERFADARGIWEKLLARPAAERRRRTVWAAFMIGKANLRLDPAKAAPWFQRTRELSGQGFPDPLGLAASSFGWEARAAIAQKRPAEALPLYLQQMAAGDPTAINSIRFTSRKLLADPKALAQAAKSQAARPILTAYVLSRWDRIDEDGPLDPAPAKAWLAAVRSAGVSKVDQADRLAWISYRAGDFAAADEWLKRAPADAPMARWIRAKLLLRAGKLAEAETLLAQAAPGLPAALGPDHDFWQGYESSVQPAIRPRALGELGATRLAQKKYVPALDNLLRGGWWTDAAYVAEQVLTVDELRAYVDETWSAALAGRHKPDAQRNAEVAGDAWENTFAGLGSPPEPQIAYDLRYLLGRRLVRAGRLADAKAYLPAKQHAALDDLVSSLGRGNEASRPAAERSQALFRAACLDRYQGLELRGTEIEPDWFFDGGSFDQGSFAEARANPKTHSHLGPTPDEKQRVARNRAVPDKRFHYRYQGMTLAQEAAKLLPAGTEERARLLATAGNWVEGRDPEGARPLYDAIQSCCRDTDIARRSRKVNAITNIDDACPADMQPKPDSGN